MSRKIGYFDSIKSKIIYFMLTIEYEIRITTLVYYQCIVENAFLIYNTGII